MVADKLNKEGLKIGNRKYISNDISAVLKQKPMDALHQIAKSPLNIIRLDYGIFEVLIQKTRETKR
ncbi:hypothetical protein B5G50_03555 [Brevibacillus brevis]|nr:hypothetical protein B5G50_03555 [Brevibacillus brevis]